MNPRPALLLLAAILLAPAAPAQTPAPTPPFPYPRENNTIGYCVDPHWPSRPADAPAWGAMSAIVVDDQDIIWTLNRGAGKVQAYDREGHYVTGWDHEAIKVPHYFKFAPDGNIWITDIGSHVVMEFTREGELLRTLGTPGEAGVDKTHMNQPTDIVVTPAGDIFVTDGYGNNRVVHFDKEGRYVNEWGGLGLGQGEFSLPHAIALDSAGKLYVADRNNARVQIFDQTGKFLDEWKNIMVPWGFCMTEQDELWVCGSTPMLWWQPGGWPYVERKAMGVPPKDQIFARFNTAGRMLQMWGVPKGVDGQPKPGECDWLHAIAEDSAGNIYLGDVKGYRAQQFELVAPDSMR